MVKYIKSKNQNKIKEEYLTWKDALCVAANDYNEGLAYPIEIREGDRVLQGNKLINKIIEYSEKSLK